MSLRQQADTATQVLLAPGGDRDRLLEEVGSAWDGSTSEAMTVWGYTAQVRGTDEVLVTIAAYQASNPSLVVSWPLVMVWVEGTGRSILRRTRTGA
ncbi:hypothetical protein [Actinomyces faecalis]|uniref:hypothetical protein n=1 Tax=Actinomyces faecalis TaxID=2722820 RepID=UPI0015519D65|nr:hypothetical protein [Actinomyces faecalis]